jgi:hypothetical protein
MEKLTPKLKVMSAETASQDRRFTSATTMNFNKFEVNSVKDEREELDISHAFENILDQK